MCVCVCVTEIMRQLAGSLPAPYFILIFQNAVVKTEVTCIGSGGGGSVFAVRPPAGV